MFTFMCVKMALFHCAIPSGTSLASQGSFAHTQTHLELKIEQGFTNHHLAYYHLLVSTLV